MSDPQRFEDELLRIVGSDGDPANWTVPPELERDPEFRAALDEYARVARQVSSASDEAQDLLQAAQREERPEDRAAVAAAFERARAAGEAPATVGPVEARRPRQLPKLPLIWIGSLAALFVALFGARTLWFGDEPRAVGPDQELGTRAVELLRPLGAGASFETFEWRFELPENGHFEVRVYDDERRAPLPATKSERLIESRWTPETTAGWPARIRWEVIVRDASGADVRSGSASASRSR